MSLEIHRRAENLMGAGDMALAQGDSDKAATLYEEAALAEVGAFDLVPLDRVRTRGVLAVSAVGLYRKAGNRTKATRWAHLFLADQHLAANAREVIEGLLKDLYSDVDDGDGLSFRPASPARARPTERRSSGVGRRTRRPVGGRRARRARRSLNDHRNLGVLLVGTLFTFATIFWRLPQIASHGFSDPVELLSFGMLAAALVTLVAWYGATDVELSVLFDIGGDYVPTLPSSTLPLVVLAALGLGALAIASFWPLAFATVLTALKAVELWASWPMHREIRYGITQARAHGLSQAQEEAFDVVEQYYFELPWVPLQAIGLGIAAFSMAVAAYFQDLPDSTSRQLALSLVSVVLTLSVIGHEVVVGRWRRTYFRKLDPMLDVLDESSGGGYDFDPADEADEV